MQTYLAPGAAPVVPEAPVPAPQRPRLVAVPAPHPAPEGISGLPTEWATLEGVPVAGEVIDRVIVGPNGVFAVHVDPDPRPAAVRPGHGVVRAGTRVPEGVKRALFGAAALRRRLSAVGGDLFPYPVLVTAAPGEAGHRLGRLLVVRPGRLAEAVWSHPARPLTRSRRSRVIAILSDPGS